ncbi:MAG TPA: hypothetical protein VJ962_04650 [Clostridia bacterium]|nr:hypothetical protein [Clostridia bacterium]
MYLKKFLLASILLLLLLTGCTNEYSVSVNIIPENAGEIEGSGVYESYEEVKLKAIPYEEYDFIGWEDQGYFIDEDNNYEFKIQKDENLVARFKKKKFNLEIENNNKDTGFVKGEGEYLINKKVTLSATPNDNHKFIGWFDTNDELISDQEIFELSIDSNTKVIAKFEPIIFNITLDKNIDKGEVFGEGKYMKGDKQFIRAEKLFGYNFLHWVDESGNVFTEKDGKMITISENLNLTATYEKKEQQFYLGISQDEILEILNSAYRTYFSSIDIAYFKMWEYEKTEELENAFSNEEYYIILRPQRNDGTKLRTEFYEDIQIKDIIINDNQLIINSTLKTPQIIPVVSVDEISNKLKDRLPLVNATFNSCFKYDLNNYDIFNKELRLKKVNDEIIITHFDKPDGIFQGYQELYKKIVVDPVEYINIYVIENKIQKTVVNYEGTLYEGPYNDEILKYKELYSKINFVFDDNSEINLQNFYEKLNKASLDVSVPDTYILRHIKFILDSNSKKINISMDYPTSGASLGSILSVYDLQNKDYYFVDEMTGVGSAETVKYSNDPNYISYIYKSLEPHYYLEIFNTETKQKIKLINYLPDKYVNRNENSESVWYKGFPSFKNVEWSKNTLELYFEFYIREEYDDEIEEKIGSFVFDIKKNELRKLD